MAEGSKRRLCTSILILAPTLFLLSLIGMLRHYEPFYTWFYCFAWWSYILFAEASLYRRGAFSLLFSAPTRFLQLLPLSVNVWLIFEVFNLRLHNWAYVQVPASVGIRWFGYTISFATVLPGIFTTANVIDHLSLIRSRRVPALANPDSLYKPFIIVGLVFLLLPLLWPRYFFPLVWGGFIFLLEPANHRCHVESLLREWERGSLQRFCGLLVAGACCGLLWESWNFWAGSKWVYTIPFVNFTKIFEMPILGFLGFPPFAVECYVMVASARLGISKLRENLSHRQFAVACVALIVLVIGVDCWIYWEMDRRTVISYRHEARIQPLVPDLKSAPQFALGPPPRRDEVQRSPDGS